MRDLIYDIRMGLRNLWRWRFLWRDEDFDWAYLAEIMERKLRWMAEYHESDGVTVSRHRKARQMRIAAQCLRRMHEEQYTDKASEIYIDRDKRRWGWPSECRWDVLHRQDHELLLKQLKYLREWWD